MAARPAHRAVLLAVPQVGQREQRHLRAVRARRGRRRERRLLAPTEELQRRSRAAPCQRLVGNAPQPAVRLAASAHECPTLLQYVLVGKPDARRGLTPTHTKDGKQRRQMSGQHLVAIHVEVARVRGEARHHCGVQDAWVDEAGRVGHACEWPKFNPYNDPLYGRAVPALRHMQTSS